VTFASLGVDIEMRGVAEIVAALTKPTTVIELDGAFDHFGGLLLSTFSEPPPKQSKRLQNTFLAGSRPRPDLFPIAGRHTGVNLPATDDAVESPDHVLVSHLQLRNRLVLLATTDMSAPFALEQSCRPRDVMQLRHV
jgi:hypothetical protein